MTMVWSLSPMLGFFLAPLMGSLSDRCTFGWGRRRPLILMLALLILSGLILVPWGKNIGILLGDNSTATIVNTGAAVAARMLDTNQTHSANLTNIYEYNEISDVDNSAVPFYKYAAIITILGTICLDFSADTCQTPARTYMLDICVSGKLKSADDCVCATMLMCLF